jgi:hypothetical protein
LGLALAVALLGATPPARSEDKMVERVQGAIKKGIQFLKSQQRQGNWEIEVASTTWGWGRGGYTSLVLLALLTAGVPATDPAVQKGLEYLRTIPPEKTYIVALQTMVFAQAGQGVDRQRIQDNAKWLLESRLPLGWSYSKLRSPDGPGAWADFSNTQYALLGLHAAIEAGVKVPEKDLQEIQKLYIDKQQPGGGWPYRPRQAGGIGGGEATMTMTTAGLCGLIITGMDLAVGKQKLRDDGRAENCGVYADNEPVTRSLAWIGRHFPQELTEQNARTFLQHPFYCLYGIERAGRLSGQRFFGGEDWYEVGCRFLVGAQKANGSWEGTGGRGIQADSSPMVATSFALLFLAKGRTPVLVTKLAYGGVDSSDWNNKRGDVRHLVEFASRELFKKQPLAWQVFDVRHGGRGAARDEESKWAAELLQSPIVYFNGHDFAPRDREERVLQQYLENGGFVFAEACCGSRSFDADFRQLMKRLFPDNPLKPLPPEHPVWSASGRFVSNPDDFPLEGVQYGCKTVVIYSPRPVAGYWEANWFDRKDDPTGRGQKAFQLGANVIAYATGLEPPRPRLTEVEVPPDKNREAIKRNFLKVGQLRHQGDWRPAPRAMRNLMYELSKNGLEVVLETAAVYPNDEKVYDLGFFYMHGRNDFTLDGAKLDNLRFKLQTNGTLFADACCGSKRFDASFRKFMDVLWGGKARLEPIPPGDELFSKELNGTPITAVRCRRLAADGKRVDPEYRVLAPALEGVKYNGRWVVIYSKYDVGCALEHHTSSDCLGHDYNSAVRIGRAAVLYALKR